MATKFATLFAVVLCCSLVLVTSRRGSGASRRGSASSRRRESVTSQDDSGVEEVLVPMCRNLIPYNLTKLPNSFGHETQKQVYRAIEHLWAFMDYDCSTNFRLLVCSTYLPEYDATTGRTSAPCRSTCNRAKRRCRSTFRQAKQRWPQQLNCGQLHHRRCVRPLPERSGPPNYPYCRLNTIPTCAGIPYPNGYLPNFYHQYNMTEVGLELQYYDRLLATGCNANLAFFLCGTYVPFCNRPDTFTVPCRELCDQVYGDCIDDYRRLYGDIPWPNKLQCHRYWLSTSERACSMPGDLEAETAALAEVGP